LVDAGVTSIAIVFLHAYANPRHEAQAAAVIARRHPRIAVTTSHEVAPEIREYERASTTVANAYIKPLARQYLDAMARRVAGLGIPAPLLLMLSSGGLTHVADADFVLGYLNPDYFAGGEMRIDMPAARAALERLAGRLKLSLTECAWGIHDVVNENMAGAARVHIAERGRDPRDYALLCTG